MTIAEAAVQLQAHHHLGIRAGQGNSRLKYVGRKEMSSRITRFTSLFPCREGRDRAHPDTSLQSDWRMTKISGA